MGIALSVFSCTVANPRRKHGEASFEAVEGLSRRANIVTQESVVVYGLLLGKSLVNHGVFEAVSQWVISSLVLSKGDLELQSVYGQ